MYRCMGVKFNPPPVVQLQKSVRLRATRFLNSIPLVRFARATISRSSRSASHTESYPLTGFAWTALEGPGLTGKRTSSVPLLHLAVLPRHTCILPRQKIKTPEQVRAGDYLALLAQRFFMSEAQVRSLSQCKTFYNVVAPHLQNTLVHIDL